MTIPVKIPIGKRFGRLRVLRVVPGKKYGHHRSCICQCDCGTRKDIAVSDLRSGRTTSCGCWLRESAHVRKLEDITGEKFGRLTAVRRLPENILGSGAAWLCRCDCGKKIKSTVHRLRRGNTKSCGCLKADRVRECRQQDLTGLRSGRLVAIQRSGDDGYHHSMWKCICDCGKSARISGVSLKAGKTRSCGCLHDETVTLRNMRHGACYRGAVTKEYVAFHSAKRRCTCKKIRQWKDYGGRGIRFLFKSFPQFFKELGSKPGPEYSLDRFPNSDGHYEPGNVRWATPEQQASNKRSVEKAATKRAEARKLRSAGLKQSEIARRLNVAPRTLRRYLTAA